MSAASDFLPLFVFAEERKINKMLIFLALFVIFCINLLTRMNKPSHSTLYPVSITALHPTVSESYLLSTHKTIISTIFLKFNGKL